MQRDRGLSQMMQLVASCSLACYYSVLPYWLKTIVLLMCNEKSRKAESFEMMQIWKEQHHNIGKKKSTFIWLFEDLIDIY